MKSSMIKFLCAGLIFSSLSALGEVCELTIDRKACPGQEKKAMEPYAGKNPTIEKKSAADIGECTKKATDASKIVRKGVLSEKIVTAKFGKESIGPISEKAACN